MFSPTLKVEENNVFSDLLFEYHWWICGHILNLGSNLVMAGSSKLTKCQYLWNRASNQKTKVTFISSTLKVEEKKVCSDFHLVALEKIYGHIEFLPVSPFLCYFLGSEKSTHMGRIDARQKTKVVL